jgi:hypothetical protein
MARRRTHAVTEAAPFQRTHWNREQRRRPVSFRILQLKLDIAHGITEVKDNDVVAAVFTPEEIELLQRIAAGERIVGIDLPRHIAEYQMRWIAHGGYRHDNEADGA